MPSRIGYCRPQPRQRSVSPRSSSPDRQTGQAMIASSSSDTDTATHLQYSLHFGNQFVHLFAVGGFDVQPHTWKLISPDCAYGSKAVRISDSGRPASDSNCSSTSIARMPESAR